jgi:hypothetical protein
MRRYIEVESNVKTLLRMREYALETALDAAQYRLRPDTKPDACAMSEAELEAMQTKYEGYIDLITDRICTILNGSK